MEELIEERQHDLQGGAVFGKAERDDGFLQFRTLAHVDNSAVQAGGLAGEARPKFVAEGVVNHTGNRPIARVWVRESTRSTKPPLPLTPALSLGERENGCPISVNSLLQGNRDAGV